MMIGLIVIIAVLIWLTCWVSDAETTTKHDKNSSSENGSSKEDVWNSMGSAKCLCLTCNEAVFIPTQYLERRYGVQRSRCPNCDWKMRKVKIIQTWGIL